MGKKVTKSKVKISKRKLQIVQYILLTLVYILGWTLPYVFDNEQLSLIPTIIIMIFVCCSFIMTLGLGLVLFAVILYGFIWIGETIKEWFNNTFEITNP